MLTVCFFAIVVLMCHILPIGELQSVGVYTLGTVFAIIASKKSFRWLAPRIGTADAVRKPRNVRKFADQGWQLMIHLVMTGVEVAALNEDGWRMWHDPETVWQGFMGRTPIIRALFLSQLGIWCWTAVSHRFLEARHKDYFVMYVHHILTLLLLLGAHKYDFNKIAVLVMFVHDLSDIPVDLLKMSNYLGLDSSSGLFIVEGVFGLHMFVWSMFRLYFFPSKIIGATFNESAKRLYNVRPDITNWELLVLPECWACNILRFVLILLLCLHLWWYWLSIKIVIKLVTGENAHDAGREEYEGDSSDSEAESPAKTKAS